MRRAGKRPPAVGVVLGSGLGALATRLHAALTIDFSEIPHFPVPTVPGHSGQLLFGSMDGVDVVLQRGRVHSYEGHDGAALVYSIRVMALLGAGAIVLSNAVGGICPSLSPGDLVLVTDHLNLSGLSPLRGVNDETLGPRFPDMSQAYDPGLAAVARRASLKAGIVLKDGILAFSAGPQYESPAEVRALARLGADLVGMSTVPEVVAANHLGLRVLTLSCVTNKAAGLQFEPRAHDEVLLVGRRVEGDFCALVEAVLRELAACPECCEPRRLPRLAERLGVDLWA
ncbi:MAG: purine-nucleoside phosphorylase [Candidatus Schekmanbacteria bacterium]|nr:purine-nucleoside phosphorylase [Candidatus Schekmanbacteria bacterium]